VTTTSHHSPISVTSKTSIRLSITPTTQHFFARPSPIERLANYFTPLFNLAFQVCQHILPQDSRGSGCQCCVVGEDTHHVLPGRYDEVLDLQDRTLLLPNQVALDIETDVRLLISLGCQKLDFKNHKMFCSELHDPAQVLIIVEHCSCLAKTVCHLSSYGSRSSRERMRQNLLRDHSTRKSFCVEALGIA
jgi:hypothetical protein